MATDINNLKQIIMDRISSEITTVQDVVDYEKVGFKGFPAVTVVCSENENDYWSTAENQRQFTFMIRIYINLDGNILDSKYDKRKQEAEAIMGRVVSQIIDAFDKFYAFGSEADYCQAVPSKWGYVNVAESWLRTSEIKLQVVKSFLVN